MSFSPKLRKWLRPFARPSEAQSKEAALAGPAEGAVAPRQDMPEPAPQDAMAELSLQEITVEGDKLDVLVVPALPVIDVIVQLSTVQGQVLLTQVCDGQTVRIVPGQPIAVSVPLGQASLPSGVGTYLIDASQADRHAHQSLALANRSGTFELVHPSVDSYLRDCAVMAVKAEALLPHGQGERLSMAHINDEDFVQYCYFWLLGRDADPSGLQHYLKALNEGLSRKELIIAMYDSLESVNFRRLSPPSISGQAAFPFSEAHDQMRLAMRSVSTEDI
jgi:hypothetical protein